MQAIKLCVTRIVAARGLFVLLCIASCVALIGCDSSGGRMQVHAVRGTINVKGKPAANAEVAFYGLDEALQSPDAPFPRGTTDADGHFELTSYDVADGAPAGNYAVTVVWRTGTNDDPEVNDSMPDRLRGRYADPTETPLQIEVRSGENDLPAFELK